jgi:hypothetical protein
VAAPLASKTLNTARANFADPHALIPANAGTILVTTVFGIALVGGIALGNFLKL